MTLKPDKELISHVCDRMRDDICGLTVKATKDLYRQCHLDHLTNDEATKLALILTQLISDVVEITLEMSIELVKEQRR